MSIHRTCTLFFFLFPLFLCATESGDLVHHLKQDILGRRENDPARNRRLADTLDRQGLPDDALLYYRRAVELAPESFPNRLALARALKKTGNIEESIPVYVAACELSPDNVPCARELAGLLEEMGRIEEAETVYWKLITGIPDTLSRLGVVSRLAALSERHQRTERLLSEISESSLFLTSKERALAYSQVFFQAKRFAEAQQVLEEELESEWRSGVAADPLLLARLIDIASEAEKPGDDLKYNRLRAELYPTAENRRQLEASEERFRHSFRGREASYRAEPKKFLDDLNASLLNPKTRNEAASFAIEFLPEISPEQIADSPEGVIRLFREELFPRPDRWRFAVSLWHPIRTGLRTLPDSDDLLRAFSATLIGVLPELGQNFTAELTEEFLAHPESDSFWDGYWTSDGWQSLFGTLLDSGAGTDLFLEKLTHGDFDTAAAENVKRATAAIRFRRGDFSEARHLLQSGDFLDPPRIEWLHADWALFREMENDTEPPLLEFLTRLYRDRLPLAAPEEREFVLTCYRRVASKSRNAVLLQEAAAPLLDKLERNFALAEKTDTGGNVRMVDPTTGEERSVNIYEILNELLDAATELQGLGLSKETAAMYHRYGEGKPWWTDQEGQGVFYFEKLKKIVEESE
ncbi:MAG: tetratricopeptide repeat protein [Thermoguttaceae bacterium]|jgi:tetratricopeptide (TPR) repeat protein